jgi:hypothetical protein
MILNFVSKKKCVLKEKQMFTLEKQMFTLVVHAHEWYYAWTFF